MTAPLRELCEPRRVAPLTDRGSFQRGELYADEGRVELRRVDEHGAEAIVHGSERYRVILRERDGGLDGTCTCPMGDAGVFCKHCVATALAITDDLDSAADSEQLRAFLSGWSTDRLVDLALEALARDDRLRERVALQLAQADGPDAAALTRAIDQAVGVEGFVPWQESWAYGERLDEILDELERRLADGHAQLVRELAEHFLVTLDGQIGRVDDSLDGVCSVALERAEQLHLAACAADPSVDSAQLAEWLLDVQLSSDNELLIASLTNYAHLLGDDGLDRYRALVDAALDRVPATAHTRWSLTYVAEQLARHDGNVDRLVAIMARDLSSGWHHLQIATVLDEAGREAEALEWAERGLTAGAETDTRVVDYLSDRYQAAGRAEEALALHVQRFAALSSLRDYQTMRTLAQPLRWPDVRTAALSQLRERPVDRWGRGRSTLVEILLWEGDVSGAWTEAQSGGCHDGLWRQLAEARAPERPGDAVDVFRMLVGRTLGRADQAAYEAAVELLAELEQLVGPESARVVIEEIRISHRRKRNLLKLLGARWPA